MWKNTFDHQNWFSGNEKLNYMGFGGFLPFQFIGKHNTAVLNCTFEMTRTLKKASIVFS
jgi:hypothetical protein